MAIKKDTITLIFQAILVGLAFISVPTLLVIIYNMCNPKKETQKHNPKKETHKRNPKKDMLYELTQESYDLNESIAFYEQEIPKLISDTCAIHNDIESYKKALDCLNKQDLKKHPVIELQYNISNANAKFLIHQMDSIKTKIDSIQTILDKKKQERDDNKKFQEKVLKAQYQIDYGRPLFLYNNTNKYRLQKHLNNARNNGISQRGC